MVMVGRVATAVLAASLAVLGFLTGGVPVCIGAGVFGVLAGMCGHAVAVALGRPRLPTIVRAAAGGAAAVGIVVGLAVTLGPVAAPVALIGVAALLWCHRRVARQVMAGAAAVERPAYGVSAPLSGLSNAELGREWCRSHVRLGEARTAAELDQVLAWRRSQLDEIERRDPEGFRRWAAGAGWIRGDSAPFLGS